nr:retrovirus-related Pol polyprotein from transposon TNT 1-94 [Tanacetum cinerariifolium]
MGLLYGINRVNNVDVTGFFDSDCVKDPDKGRSITGYTFLVQGYVVSWKATLQHVVTLSTTEAELEDLSRTGPYKCKGFLEFFDCPGSRQGVEDLKEMRALLIQHGCEAALEVLPADMEAQTKAELNKKAHSAVILCLGNKVLREVTGDTTAAGVWSKLETLYMTKSLANKLYLKKKLYTFYMPTGRKIFEHIDEFNKSKSKKALRRRGGDDEGLYVRGRTDHKDSRQSRGNSRSKSRDGRLKCYICQSKDHLRRNCLKNNRKKSTSYVKKDEQPNSSGSTYDDLRIRKDNYVYSLDGHAMAGELNASVEEKDSLAQVWHKRLRHINEAGLQVLENLWGPSQVESLKGKRYFVSIIDDYSRREFEQLCIESEIARHLTVVGTPQQNGVAERINRTLMDKVRCLLIQSGLPKTFWAEATCMGAYLINRLPPRAIEKKTPMEMWWGHPSDFEMLRIFCCVTYPYDKQVTSRNVVFNESVMYKDTLKDFGASDNSVEELQVEVELQRDQATDQSPDLTDYQLVRDREPRTRTKSLRFRDKSNMAAYAFVAAEKENTHEPLTYQEAVACEDSSKWKAAMKEEMDSLRKNKAWELVDHPAGQKLTPSESYDSDP